MSTSSNLNLISHELLIAPQSLRGKDTQIYGAMSHNWTSMASQQTCQAECPAGRELGFLGQGTPGKLLPVSAVFQRQVPLLPCPSCTRWSQQEHKSWEEHLIQSILGQRILALPRQSKLKQNKLLKKFFIFEEIPELRKAETNLQFMDLGTLGWSDQAAASPHRDQHDTFPPLEQPGNRE